MNEFVAIAKTAEIADPGKLCVEVDGQFVVVVKIDGEYYCIDDVCTHDGGPLGEGPLVGHCLACPRHGAQFDVRTGKPVTMPATVPTSVHEVKIDGDDILVRRHSNH